MSLSRRDFLQGVSAAALMVGSLAPARPIAAITPQTGSSREPSGKVQIGIGGQSMGMFNNFALAGQDVHNGLGNLIGSGGALNLNSDGYPQGTLTATIGAVFFLSSDITTSTDMVIRWAGSTGTGAISIALGQWIERGRSGFVSGGMFKGTNGRVVFRFTTVNGFSTQPYGCRFDFAAGTYTNLSGLVICRLADEARAVDNKTPEAMLNDAWIEAVKGCNPKTIRVMGLVNPNNGNNVSQHAHRRPWKTGICMYGSRWVPECWSGAFSGSTAFAASAPPGWKGLVDGAVVQGFGISTMTGGLPTLNVAGTGAFPIDNMNGSFLTITIGGTVAVGDVVSATFSQSILNNGSPRTVSFTTTATTQANAAAGLAAVINSDTVLQTAGVHATNPAIGGTPNQITIIFDSRVENGPMALTAAATTGAETMTVSHGSGGQKANTAVSYTFDAVLGKWLMGYTALQTQVPLEFCVAIANRCNANLWYTLPPHIDDASVSQITQYVRDHLNPNLHFYLEYGNEWWNSGGGFPQFFWADKRGRVLGLNYYQFVGLRNKQIMDLATTAWSPRSMSQLRRTTMHAMQPDGAFSGSALDSFRLKGQGLKNSTVTAAGKAVYASAINADYTVAPHRPVDATDVIGYANYWAGTSIPQFDANWVGFAGLQHGGPDVLASGDLPPKTGLIGAANDYFKNVGNDRSNALDFIDWDVRGGLVINVGVAVTFSGDTVTVASKWPVLAIGQQVTFKITSGGPLPSPLVEYRNYFIVAVPKSNVFKFSTTQGGSPITVSGGAGTFAYANSGVYGENLNSLVYSSSGNTFKKWDDYYATWDAPRALLGLPPLDCELYEGGFSAEVPAVAFFSGKLGFNASDATTYGGPTGRIKTLLTAYKNDARFKKACLDFFGAFKSLSHSKTPVNFIIDGGNQWGMYPTATMIGTTPFKSYDAVRDF